MIWTIYGLTDPSDGRVRYVGQTGRFEQRIRDHQAAHRRWINGGVDLLAWLKSLRAPCGYVILELAESSDAAKAAEVKWIHLGQKLDWPLVNVLKRQAKHRPLLDSAPVAV